RYAKGLGRLEVDHQLELGWCLHRQVSRFFAFKDTIDVVGSTAVLIVDVWPIRNQPAGDDRRTIPIDRRELVPGCQGDDQVTMNPPQRTSCHNQAAIRSLRESGDLMFDLARVAYPDRNRFHPKRCCYRLDRAELANPRGYAGLSKDRHPAHAR